MKLRDRLGLGPGLQRRLTWLMEAGLVGMLAVGLYLGNTGVIVNAGVALLVAQLPPILRRDYAIPLDPALTLWITAAVFLHALGTLVVPGSSLSVYATVWWYDHLTHALSASVVAAASYATIRAVDVHSDDIYLPPRLTFVFVLLFAIAFGVLWEVLEFGLAELATAIGTERPLTQYGLEDTMLDLVFDVVGAGLVALWGTVYLTDVVGALSERLADRERS